ncbi:MAG: thiamine phosphate synthase [Alphaproteobacteria bacterium]
MTERCRLYLITPPRLEPEPFADRLGEALQAGDVACVQLRLKDAGDDAVRRASECLMPVCHAHDVAFLVNDRPDLAAELGADGVHIGAEDADFETARRMVGADRIVGVSCYGSRHRAMEAGEKGADYVAFGAFFPTETKAPRAHPGAEILRWWSELTVVPCVAIGGITPENCAPLVEAGADFLAAVSAIWEREDGPGGAVKAFNEAIERARPS